MTEFLYEVNSAWIAVGLFATMVAAVELGHRIGAARAPSTSEASKEHIQGIQATFLGILALLLGFTLSLALQRFDSRSEAVVDEANAIGTAYLRADLLPEGLRGEGRRLIGGYVDLRVRASDLSAVEHAERQRLGEAQSRAQAALWALARRGVEADPNAYVPTLFAEAVNALVDSQGRREAALQRHVPEVVLVLLGATLLMSGWVVGYAAGVAGHRPSMVGYLMVLLIVVTVFMVLDLDRPRRGLILVSQQSMLDLQAGIRAAAPR
ncbi:MAG: hypothetical protein U1F53_02060 [Burkholderiaceae bacterium]